MAAVWSVGLVGLLGGSSSVRRIETLPLPPAGKYQSQYG